MHNRPIPEGVPADGVNGRGQDARREGEDGEGEVIVGSNKQMWLQSPDRQTED